MAAAWVDERHPDVLHVARGVGRPLWIARGRHELLFASTRAALEVVERVLSTTFRKTQVEEGRLLAVVDGSLADESRWSPERGFREDKELPAVRAPNEGASASSASPRSPSSPPPLEQPAVRAYADALLAQAAHARNWNADHAPGCTSTMR